MDINEYSEQYIKFLTDHFINSMTNQISHRIVDNVTERVNSFDVKAEIDRQVDAVVASAIAAYRSANLDGAQAVGERMISEFRSSTHAYLDQLTADVRSRVMNEFHNQVNAIDISGMVREQCNIILSAAIKNNTLQFPDRSIPGSAVNHDSIQVKADNILPGVIKRFTSAGIEDLSTQCQLTVTDAMTILENRLVAQDLEVRGQLVMNGDVDNKFTDRIATAAVAKIEQTYSDGTFDQYVHRVLTKLNEEGIDAGHIRVQGSAIVENSTLNPTITQSNLRRVGLLSELEVAGEVLFDDTLYVRSGKVGVNTIEPEYSLDIWDQEVQVIATKRQKDTAFIGTIKNQTVILGTGGKDQLTLHANGDITLERVSIGRVQHSSAPWRPTDNRQLGEIVWNEQPQVGQPIGWVSLGGARWAQFGTITE